MTDPAPLWAPWRLDYIKSTDRDEDCFLCRYRDADPSEDAHNLVIGRGERTICLLNRFPYNNGHLLVAPLEHVGDLEDVSVDVLAECMSELKRWTGRLRERMSPDGFNIGLNVGQVAGADRRQRQRDSPVAGITPWATAQREVCRLIVPVEFVPIAAYHETPGSLVTVPTRLPAGTFHRSRYHAAC